MPVVCIALQRVLGDGEMVYVLVARDVGGLKQTTELISKEGKGSSSEQLYYNDRSAPVEVEEVE